MEPKHRDAKEWAAPGPHRAPRPRETPAGWLIKLRADPAALANPQPHVRNLLRPDQPLFLVDTGASTSCISIDMLDDHERRSIDSQSYMPYHMRAVNGDNIQVFGKVTLNVQFDNQLHRCRFLVTALPQPVLGWDFLRDHFAQLEAAPETV